jgi:L-threonylcarbamoyladenylate synthase
VISPEAEAEPTEREAELGASIRHAVEILREGGLVAFPTETVYGLGADATNSDAVARLFSVKGRPADHPLIVHVADRAGFDRVGELTDAARQLAGALWPGPITLVVRRRPGAVVDAVTGGRDTIAVRVPGHALAFELLTLFGGPIAAPSANRFGRVSPTTAADVEADLGDDVDLVLDGGPCAVGVESTIVDCTIDVPEILRVGGVSAETLVQALGYQVHVRAGATGVPGTHASHYAPSAAVVPVEAGEASDVSARLRADGERVGIIGSDVQGAVVLGVAETADDYARSLYSWLRDADRLGLDAVVAVLPEDEGIGAAVRDRLLRASRGHEGSDR